MAHGFGSWENHFLSGEDTGPRSKRAKRRQDVSSSAQEGFDPLAISIAIAASEQQQQQPSPQQQQKQKLSSRTIEIMKVQPASEIVVVPDGVPRRKKERGIQIDYWGGVRVGGGRAGLRNGVLVALPKAAMEPAIRDHPDVPDPCTVVGCLESVWRGSEEGLPLMVTISSTYFPEAVAVSSDVAVDSDVILKDERYQVSASCLIGLAVISGSSVDFGAPVETGGGLGDPVLMAAIRISQKISSSGEISSVEGFVVSVRDGSNTEPECRYPEPPVGCVLGEPLFLGLPHGEMRASLESAVVE